MKTNEANALNEFKLRLVADPLDGAKVYGSGRKAQPQLAVSIYDNQPRITVYTNVENDRNSGKIEANMDSPTMWALLDAIITAANDRNAQAVAIENHGFTFYPKKSEHPVKISTTYVGRNGSGEVFISVVAKDRPKAIFVFKPTEWHRWADKDGNELDRAQVSERYARAWATNIGRLLNNALNDGYIPYEDIKARKDANSRNRGGGGNRGGQSGGGYQNNRQQNNSNNNDEFDDEIPF